MEVIFDSGTPEKPSEVKVISQKLWSTLYTKENLGIVAFVLAGLAVSGLDYYYPRLWHNIYQCIYPYATRAYYFCSTTFTQWLLADNGRNATIILTAWVVFVALSYRLDYHMERVRKELNFLKTCFWSLEAYLYELDPQFDDDRTADEEYWERVRNGDLSGGYDHCMHINRKECQGKRCLLSLRRIPFEKPEEQATETTISK